MTAPKVIGGIPADKDMVRPFGLSFRPVGHHMNDYEVDTVALTVPERTTTGDLHFVQVEYALDDFYQLHEAVNDLYDHIREEQSTD